MPRVHCAGILVADVFVPPVVRLPEAGELLATGDFLLEPGGCAANVAVALRRLGVEVSLAGRVGDDLFGELVRRDLSALGIDTRGVLTTPGSGTSKTVIIAVEGEDRRYLHTFGANAALAADDIASPGLAVAEVVYIGGYWILPALREEELVPRLEAARARGAKIILDVVVPAGGRPPLEATSLLLPHVDYFVPNVDEAFALTGEADPHRQAELLLERGPRAVIVKRGAAGSHVRVDGGAFDLGAPPITVVDPSGAGDGFAAGLAVGILEGWDLERTVRFASAIGASACTALGCADGIFARDEAEAFLQAHPLPVVES